MSIAVRRLRAEGIDQDSARMPLVHVEPHWFFRHFLRRHEKGAQWAPKSLMQWWAVMDSNHRPKD